MANADRIRAKIEKIRAATQAAIRTAWDRASGLTVGSAVHTEAWAEVDRLSAERRALEDELLHVLGREAGGMEFLTVETVMEFTRTRDWRHRSRELRRAGIRTVGDAVVLWAMSGDFRSIHRHHLLRLEGALRRARYVVEKTRTGYRLVRKPKWYFERRSE